jgi:hypothetical protein
VSYHLQPQNRVKQNAIFLVKVQLILAESAMDANVIVAFIAGKTLCQMSFTLGT